MSAGPRVVACGGGHGLAASLAALRSLTDRLTAVVTVADDGGSSGRLRAELGALPPGDLRMALAALAADDAWGRTWTDLVQHRFTGIGPLAGHPIGNLLLTGLADVVGGPVPALDLLGRLLGIRGRVLPLATEPLDIVADVTGLDPNNRLTHTEVRGQVAVATTTGRVVDVRLEPDDAVACPAAVEAVLDADWLILGPGSWFTSVIPHLLVPGLAKAIESTAGRRLLALNLVPQPGETEGFSAETHLEVLAAHAPQLRFDVVLADPTSIDPAGTPALAECAAGFGAELVVRPLAGGDGSPRHDPTRLAAAFDEIFTRYRGERPWQ
ncbi:MAG TPA: uridine diphosphate-N-acetylglucosamine-binding protein YvcK [Mycobacteriales bacterium]|nr:uridine diphosphate-N-acetylglucosamine-binding protein YvcK [Mycobacteriales bacterium]